MSGDFDYEFNGNTYEGFVARPATEGESPLVLVAHAWCGLGDHEKRSCHAASHVSAIPALQSMCMARVSAARALKRTRL